MLSSKKLLVVPALAAALMISGCGGEQQEVAATIEGGDPIAEIIGQDYQAWLQVAVRDVAKRCADRGGSDKAQQRCAADGKAIMKEQVLNGLIGDAWAVNEARSRGVILSAADKRKISAALKTRASAAKISGSVKTISSKYWLPRFRAEALLDKMAENKLKSGNISLTDKEAKEEYNNNRQRYYQPATVDMILVPNKDKVLIAKIVELLKKGQNINSIFSDLGVSLQTSPVARRITAQGLPEDARPLFNLPVGQVYGPKRVAGAWTVAQVLKRYPGRQLSFNEVRNDIKEEGAKNKARSLLLSELKNIWRPRTTCMKGYSSFLCKNRPFAPPKQISE